ncbi:MAG TPA: transcription termination/antitermination NusG family protein [Candidatus Polarisedimenticolia bacterium]|nr:transcription termination/antitermination NusG family protein [Candidatus Polarisedimenticolia bacterium]
MIPQGGLGHRWYAVSTRPRKEELVRVLLCQAGLPVVLPLVLEWSPSRRRMREKVGLLFPGYLFVRFLAGRDLAKVRWTAGVRSVLGAGDCPTPVSDALIEEIVSRMAPRGYIQQRPELGPGEQVEVRRGPLTGLMGVVESASTSRERVRVLLTLFDRRTAVELELHDLARIGALPAVEGRNR